MIYVDLGKLEVPDELQQKLEEATEELLTKETDEKRKACINRGANLWQEMRPVLAKLTGESENDCKCWYCESKGPGFTYHVDHFRPKNRVKDFNRQEESGYWWLAFDPTNYRLSCQRCNTGAGKRDQFPLAASCGRVSEPASDIDDEEPLLLDPTQAGDPLLLAYSEDGRVYPRHSPDSFPGIRAETSVGVYDLNHVSKTEARKAAWLDCSELAQRAMRALGQLVTSPIEAQQVARERFEDVCQDIRRRVSRCAEYSAMARYCFRGVGEPWMLELV